MPFDRERRGEEGVSTGEFELFEEERAPVRGSFEWVSGAIFLLGGVAGALAVIASFCRAFACHKALAPFLR